jgi:hypothetical protein
LGNDIDTLIRTLSGKNRGDQQLKRRFEIQLTMSVGISFHEPLDNALNSFFGSHLFASQKAA